MTETELNLVLHYIDDAVQKLLDIKIDNVDSETATTLGTLALACLITRTEARRLQSVDDILNFVKCIIYVAYHLGREDGLGIRGSNLLKGIK